MRHLPRHTRAFSTQVNPDPTPAPNGRRVLVVGRVLRSACGNCGGFQTAKVLIGGQLVTVHCPECSPASSEDFAEVA